MKEEKQLDLSFASTESERKKLQNTAEAQRTSRKVMIWKFILINYFLFY